MRASRGWSVGLAAVGLGVVACSSHDAPPPAPTSPPAATSAATAEPAAPTPPAPGASTAPQPAQPRDEAPARALLASWLAAQNARDFAAYEALYAAKLEGVKRVGSRTYRYDRGGWLADRKRMFKKAMTVTAADVEVRAGAVTTTLTFTQSFAQGAFADRGPKRLVLAREANALRIVREEMLRSEVQAGAAATASSSQAFLVLPIGAVPHVVIRAEPAGARGDAPLLLQGPFLDVDWLATQDASTSSVAPAWANRALQVYDAEGHACDATVGALSRVAGGMPHFSEVQAWDGYPDGRVDDDSPPTAKVWSKAERAAEIYAMSDPYLVAALSVHGACKPLLALEADAKPVVFAREPAIKTLDAAAMKAFAGLREYAALRKEQADPHDVWADSVEIESFAGSGRRFVHVSGVGDEGGCDDPALSVLFEDRSGKLEAVLGPFTSLRVDMVVDTDADGVAEVIGSAEPYVALTARYVLDPEVPSDQRTAVTDVTFPFNDCGC